MNRNQIHGILLSAFALAASLSAPSPAPAQDAKQPYPTMAPVEQYLMDRDAEIALARSAAPDAISRDATVLVLGQQGLTRRVRARQGRGFQRKFLNRREK